MSITLKPDNQAWLEQQVKEGNLPSVDVGINLAIEALKAIQTDDLAWAKPLVDEAREDVANGKTQPAAPLIASLRQHSVR